MEKHLILPFRIIVEHSQSLIPGTIVQGNSDIFAQVFKITKEGKLLSLFCNYMEHFPRHLKTYLKKRCQLTKLYQKYLMIIAEELNSEGIEYYVFKTVKPFAYDMTDIDILIPNKRELFITSRRLMRKYGFRIISKGTYSVTLRKTINEFDIDLDLQTRIAAGTFEYIVNSDLKKQIGDIGYISNGLSLLRPEIELTVVIGHTFYKDLEIPIANILHARDLLKIIDKHRLGVILSNYRYLLRAFKLLNYIVSIFHKILNTDVDVEKRSFQKDREYFIMARSFYSAIKEMRGSIKIPLVLVAELYGETIKILVESRRYTQLKEIINLPRSRGIGLLLRRIGFLPPEETIKV